MAGRVTQLAVEVLRAGGPRALVTQAAVEVLRTGSPRSRLTQESVEVLRSSADQAVAGGAVMVGGGLGIGLSIGIPQAWQVPGGGAPPFDPTSVAGLKLWLKADLGAFQDAALTTPAVADGDPVGGWQDQSGQSHHATQGTAANRPTLKLAVQNGLPVLRFNGVNNFLGVAYNLVTATGAITGFVVYRGLPASAAACLFSDGPLTSGLAMGVGAGTFDAAGGNLLSAAAGLAWTATGLTHNTVGAVGWIYNNQANAFFRDGVAGATPTQNIVTANLNMFIASNSGTSRFVSGDICEVLYYQGALSVANRQAVEGYLRGRWGTP